MNSIPTVGILIIKENKVLLVKHGERASHITGVYGWPGGRYEEGESPRQAAVRELFEETGLKTSEEDLIEVHYDLGEVTLERKNGLIQTFTATLFLCEDYEGDLQGNEETIPEWVAIEELEKYHLLPNTKRVVHFLLPIV